MFRRIYILNEFLTIKNYPAVKNFFNFHTRACKHAHKIDTTLGCLKYEPVVLKSHGIHPMDHMPYSSFWALKCL